MEFGAAEIFEKDSDAKSVTFRKVHKSQNRGTSSVFRFEYGDSFPKTKKIIKKLRENEWLVEEN